ncbi:unnamed protein product [Effrenium voratum]|uniref:Uncharacterized protein n=1 Tax=Effrenium voratum TaxID=2562239 RepID=A0AA36MWC8_9DINO|nr:unnamed protein product [Effrenium voratum]
MCDVSRKRSEYRKCAFQHPLLVAFWFKADAGFAESSWIVQVAPDWTFRWPVWELTVFPLNWCSFFPGWQVLLGVPSPVMRGSDVKVPALPKREVSARAVKRGSGL